MAKNSRACSACGKRMQSFYAEGVNLDRCPACHATWLDAGELDALTNGRVKVEAFDAETDRECHACRKGLQTRMLSVGVPVEECPSCHGLFLDAGELEEVNWHEDAETQRKDEKLAKFFFFFCASCGERQDTKKARDTEDGLICASCFKAKYPQSAPTKAAPVEEEGRLRAFFRKLTG